LTKLTLTKENFDEKHIVTKKTFGEINFDEQKLLTKSLMNKTLTEIVKFSPGPGTNNGVF